MSTFKEHKLLSELSTFGIGGTARYFVEVRSVEEMQRVLFACHQDQLRYLIIGKGSNCLFDDRGFDGLVIQNKIDFFESPKPGFFHVGAGYSFSLLGVQTARQGFAGLEFASGIPASVGGAVFMNAGANGQETCDILSTVDFIDDAGEKHILNRSDLSFSYRSSLFQKMLGAIVGATFALKLGFAAREKQLQIIDYRKKTQPLKDPSAGCIFRNPTNTTAGTLIDRCGLKGLSVGGAMVSDKHANFIVNTGSATAKQVLELIQTVQQRVKESSGIELESEVRIIPYQITDSSNP